MIVVTGATGLVGSHLLYELTQREESIRAIYRSDSRIDLVRKIFQFYSPENWTTHFNKIEWIQGDILDVVGLSEIIPIGAQVYHCAALVSFDHKAFNQLMQVNRNGTENIVNICLEKKVKKLCYVSSTAAIGGDENLINEETKWKNDTETSCYSISKYCAEREVWRGIEEGLNAVIINPCVIFGPGLWTDSSLAIFETMKKGMKYYPPGANATVDVRDVVKAMILLMNSDIHSERYLCVGSNQSFKELMTEIAFQTNVKPPIVETARWQVNLARFALGFLSFFTRKRPKINKDTVSNLFARRSYDNRKIKTAIEIEFYSLKEQVSNSMKGKID